MDSKKPKGFEMAEKTIKEVLSDLGIEETKIEDASSKIMASFLLGMLMEVTFSKSEQPKPKNDFNPFGGF